MHEGNQQKLGKAKILKRPVNTSDFHLAEVGTCSLATFPCLVKSLCEAGGGRFYLVREEWSENFVLFSKFFFSSDIWICFLLQNPDGMILKELCLFFLAFSGLAPCGLKDLLLVPKIKKLNGDWSWMCSSVIPQNLHFELSPFSSDSHPPQHTHMLICSDLCRVRNLTFSLFFTCREYRCWEKCKIM